MGVCGRTPKEDLRMNSFSKFHQSIKSPTPKIYEEKLDAFDENIMDALKNARTKLLKALHLNYILGF